MPSESPLPTPPGALPPDIGIESTGSDTLNDDPKDLHTPTADNRHSKTSRTESSNTAAENPQVVDTVADSPLSPTMDGINESKMCEISEEGEDRIVEVARSLSRVSREHGRGINTFLDPTSRPDLDPHSERFSARRWVSNMLDVCSRDPESYPRRSAGVSFRNLNVFGYGSAVDYQTNVGNVWLKGFGWVQRLLGVERKVRIDILREFEGFVRSGEMLIVLGRPGRYGFCFCVLCVGFTDVCACVCVCLLVEVAARRF